MKLKNKDIREKNKKLNKQIKIENTSKTKWNKLMKLKQKLLKIYLIKKDIKFNL